MGYRCVRFRVLACCRVGKRGAFARTVVLREAPSQKLRAPVLQASESYLRPPELLQQGNWPKGQPNGTQWTGVFGLGLKGSLESSLRLPKLVQRADGHEMESDLV